MFRVGFIGAGDVVRRSYLPVLSQRADCKLVAICSQSGQSAQEVANQHGIKSVFNDYNQLLQQPEIDTIFICTPTYLHQQMAEAAMAQGKHVLVEKPLCTTYQDSSALLQQARNYDKTFYAAFNNQFRVENQWLRQEVLIGNVGQPELIDFEWYRTKRHADKNWLYDLDQSGGGVLVDLGAHMIHFGLSLLPNRKQYWVSCRNISHSAFSCSVEDTSVSMISIDNKLTFLLKLGWDMQLPKRSRVTLEVFGLTGRISNHDFAKVKGHDSQPKSDGYDLMIADFLDHIKANTKPDFNLVDDSMKLLADLYQSSHSQSTIAGEFYGTLGSSEKIMIPIIIVLSNKTGQI